MYNRGPMVPAPSCYYDPEVLDPRNRADGVSAMLRVRNGAQFLRPSLRSCIDVFDEIVAVHHQCSDDTPRILHEYAAAYPDRFKVYEYPHEVIPPNTARHMRERADSLSTIAALCNYALSKTTRRFVIKHDADHVYFRPRFARLVEAVRARDARAGPVFVSGVNLARARAGAVGVWLQNPICGVGDYGFFPVSRDTYFVHNDRHEHLSSAHRRHAYAGVAFWHLKMLQKYFGLREYRFRYEGDYEGLQRRCRAIEESLEVIPPARFIASFSGADSPFIDRHCKNPLWRNRVTRPAMWHLARPLARLPVCNRVRWLHLLLSFRLARDVRGASLPPEQEWTGGEGTAPERPTRAGVL